jgi:GPH family glycoside/pentoside/hexuronide:cation symporter
MVSFGAANFGLRSIPNIMVQRFTFFYETEILFPIELMTLAIVIYTIWDMFNDPLAGHLTDRNYRFTRKWGRRFPWILVSSLGMFFAFILFFMPPDPQINVWATFFWFLIMFMCFDGLLSLATVAYQSLLPNKYRTLQERLKVSAIVESISAVGLILGFILPPMIIEYGNPDTYVVMALVSGFLLIISIFLGIPGMREEKELIDRYYQEDQEPFLQSFFRMFKISLGQKNFRAIVYAFIGISVFNTLFVASISYYVAFVLNEPAEFELMLYLPYLLTVILPIPFYYWLAKKFGHLNVVIFANFLLPTILVVMTFVYADITAVMILVGIIGMSNGMLNISYIPLYGDFFDEAALLNKKRLEGFYNGFQTFFGRTVFILQLVVFWIIHELTQFDPKATIPQNQAAQFGIIIHWLIIPAIALYIGIILFVRIYDLKPDRVLEIKTQLEEINL